MHYTGMAAMRQRAMHYYDHTLCTLSIVPARSSRSLVY